MIGFAEVLDQTLGCFISGTAILAACWLILTIIPETLAKQFPKLKTITLNKFAESALILIFCPLLFAGGFIAFICPVLMLCMVADARFSPLIDGQPVYFDPSAPRASAMALGVYHFFLALGASPFISKTCTLLVKIAAAITTIATYRKYFKLGAKFLVNRRNTASGS